MRRIAALLLFGLGGTAWADTLILPGAAFERAGTVAARYTIDAPRAQQTDLTLEWTDSLGRLVARLPAVIQAGATSVSIPLDLRLAVAMRNHLRARLSTGGEAVAEFIARPQAGDWADFEVMMWHERPTPQTKILRDAGLTGSKVFGFRGPVDAPMLRERLAAPLAADLRVFVENIATDFYAPYHRWTPEHPDNVIWLFDEAKRLHQADPASLAPFIRTPSLSDPAWIARIRTRLAEHAQAFGAYRPFYYSLGDETGIADLTASWDFDFSAPSLAGFRSWLRGQYGSLAALNEEWATNFTSWETITPPTTTAAMAREGDNFAPWFDFKSWMDEAFARALHAGTASLHTADPTARSAIEGAQTPSTGGYDYARIADSVDVMEFSDSETALPVALSLNPALVALTTIVGGGPQEAAQLWRAALSGVRGAVIWDEDGGFLQPDSSPAPRAQADMAVVGELRRGLGALLIASPPSEDGVAILYSPASQRIGWMLDHRAGGEAWTQRRSETELEDNAGRIATRRAASLLRHLGLRPRFVASLSRLTDDGVRVLILPHTLVLSAADTAALTSFVANGGTVLADLPPGQFDEHGKRLAASRLAELTLPPIPGDLMGMAELLARAGVIPQIRLTRTDGVWADDVAIHVRRNGAVTLLGLQPDQPGGTARDVDLWWSDAAVVHDLRTGETALATDRLRVRLDPLAPTLLALTPTPLPGPTLRAPPRMTLGSVAEIAVALAGGGPAAMDVVRIEAIDPAGLTRPHLSANLVLRDGMARWNFVVARNDPSGVWTLRARSLLGGGTASLRVDIDAQ